MYGYTYMQDYTLYLVAMIGILILSAIASSRVKSTFKKFDKVPCHSRLTGAEVASRLLKSGGAYDISIGCVGGELSDHYHPAKAIVNLSQSTYNSSSVAAVAVAAHEIGHVMQKKNGYFLYNVRTALVPVVNAGSFLAFPLVLIGLLLDSFVRVSDPNTGFYIAMGGVVLYGGSLLFSLVTLPVELDASRRAKEMLLENHVISENELPAATKVLNAAAFTYVVSVLAALVNFMRFLLYVLRLFGRRD